MSRRHAAEKRIILPDAKYGDVVVAKFVNCVMTRGKKSIAEAIVYGAFEIVVQRSRQDPLEVFRNAIRNVRPSVEVRSRRIGGATYQVPVDVRDVRSLALAIRWIIRSAAKRAEKTMRERLAAELMDAAQSRGGAIKTSEEGRKSAEANRAFSHYRW
jgi:small subunit ribosomal protein S7